MKRVTTLIMMLLSLALVFSVSAFAAPKAETKANTAMSNQAAKASVTATAEKVNINTADAAVLTKIPGIGQKKAEAIVAYRKANGNFKTVDDLQKVKGIGPKILEKIKAKITI